MKIESIKIFQLVDVSNYSRNAWVGTSSWKRLLKNPGVEYFKLESSNWNLKKMMLESSSRTLNFFSAVFNIALKTFQLKSKFSVVICNMKLVTGTKFLTCRRWQLRFPTTVDTPESAPWPTSRESTSKPNTAQWFLKVFTLMLGLLWGQHSIYNLWYFHLCTAEIS